MHASYSYSKLQDKGLRTSDKQLAQSEQNMNFNDYERFSRSTREIPASNNAA